MFIKNPPRRRFRFSLLFNIRKAEVITSFYQVTAMEQLDTLIFDALIKLRNNKKQPNKNSIHTFNIKGLQIIKQKTIRGKIIDTH